jgi:hypothetical protein
MDIEPNNLRQIEDTEQENLLSDEDITNKEVEQVEKSLEDMGISKEDIEKIKGLLSHNKLIEIESMREEKGWSEDIYKTKEFQKEDLQLMLMRQYTWLCSGYINYRYNHYDPRKHKEELDDASELNKIKILQDNMGVSLSDEQRALLEEDYSLESVVVNLVRSKKSVKAKELIDLLGKERVNIKDNSNASNIAEGMFYAKDELVENEKDGKLLEDEIIAILDMFELSDESKQVLFSTLVNKVVWSHNEQLRDVRFLEKVREKLGDQISIDQETRQSVLSHAINQYQQSLRLAHRDKYKTIEEQMADLRFTDNPGYQSLFDQYKKEQEIIEYVFGEEASKTQIFIKIKSAFEEKSVEGYFDDIERFQNDLDGLKGSQYYSLVESEFFDNMKAMMLLHKLEEIGNIGKYFRPDISLGQIIKECFQKSLDQEDYEFIWKIVSQTGMYPELEKLYEEFEVSMKDIFFNTSQEFTTRKKAQNFLLAKYDQGRDTGIEVEERFEFLTLEEYIVCKFELEKLGEEEDNDKTYKAVYEQLKDNVSEWQDYENINGPFEEASKVFGYERMMQYVRADKGAGEGKETTLHDKLHNFAQVMRLYNTSNMSAEDFYKNILVQVTQDTGHTEVVQEQTYDEDENEVRDIMGSYARLQIIAKNLDLNEYELEGVQDKAQKYKYDIPEMEELLANYDTSDKILQSWKSLKRYFDLANLLDRSQALDALVGLRQEGREHLYQYVRTLVFHPDSKVDINAAMEFWKTPERFLARLDEHTPDEVQNRKKPSNYVEMPNLDLSADELVDAMVEGDMDRIQAFPYMEVEYESGGPLLTKVKRALGSRKDNIQGKAQNPKKLFAELNNILKPLGGDVSKYISR